MGSGKRASMREGPLAALFRKTETEGLEAGATPDRRRPEADEDDSYTHLTLPTILRV